MFINILKSAENSAKVIKEIITYKADGNGIKTVKKELLSLAEVYKDNSINGLFADATEPENNGIIIYKDFSLCLEVAKVWNTPTAEQMQKALQNYNGKNGKTQIQIERIFDVLSKIKGYSDNGKVEYKSRKDFIIDTLAEGGKAEQKDGVISYYGSKWDRKQSKPKTEYRLYTAEGSYYTITKIEFDFACYMMQKSE